MDITYIPMARGFVYLAAAVSKQVAADRAGPVACPHAQPVQIFQQLARSDPPRGDDVRPLPAVVAQRRGPAGRARPRYLPRNRQTLVEPLWSRVRCGDQEAAPIAAPRLPRVALAPRRSLCEDQRQDPLSMACSRPRGRST